MTPALLLIDIQYDFCAGGALEVPTGNDVIPIANAMMKRFDTIVATQDWHPTKHGSFASVHNRSPYEVIDLHGLNQVLWPDHCIQGSKGADFHSDLHQHSIGHVIQKGMDPTVDSYSGFSDNGGRIETKLHAHLQTLSVDTLYICGLATDYCVKFTVLDALDRGYAVFLIVDGCRGVNQHPEDSQQAFVEMEQVGAQLISSIDVPNNKTGRPS
jgi:nicotinamidase/pyrazinamidase